MLRKHRSFHTGETQPSHRTRSLSRAETASTAVPVVHPGTDPNSLAAPCAGTARHRQTPLRRNRLRGGLGESAAFQARIFFFFNESTSSSENQLNKGKTRSPDSSSHSGFHPTSLQLFVPAAGCGWSHTHHPRPKTSCQHLPPAYAGNGNQQKGDGFIFSDSKRTAF